MRHAYRDPATLAEPRERIVENAAGRTAWCNEQVRHLDVALAIERAACCRAGAAKDADEVLVPQRFIVNVRGRVAEHPDGEIELVRDAVERGRAHVETDSWCVAAETFCEAREQNERRLIRHRDRERALRGRRIEQRSRTEHGFRSLEREPHRRAQLERAWRGGHAVLRADEEVVAEQVAQSAERVTHGGLTDPELLRRARDVAFLEECIERGEQIQIDTGEPHDMTMTNNKDEDNRFGLWRSQTHPEGIQEGAFMYAIAGVSGHTGAVVANTLLAAGKPVRVIVRDAAKGAEWSAKGAEVAVASLDDRAALARALRGATGAYLLIPPNGWTQTNLATDRAKYAAAIVGAVGDARPGHVVLLSSIGAQHAKGTGPIQYIHPIEIGLNALGVPSTFLRPAFFMENWGGVLKGALESGTLYYGLSVRIPQVATGDIGKTAARLLVEGAPAKTRVVNLAGPQDLTLQDVAATLSRVTGKAISGVSVPPSAMTESLVGMGASRELAEMYGEMATAMNDGRIVWEGDVTVRGSITLEQRLRELLA